MFAMSRCLTACVLLLLALQCMSVLTTDALEGRLYGRTRREAEDGDWEEGEENVQGMDASERNWTIHFEITKCPDAKENSIIRPGVTIEPSPVRVPGDMTVAIFLDVTQDLSPSPVVVKLKVRKKMSMLFGNDRWLEIPCLPQGFGSCTIKNACDVPPFANGTCVEPSTQSDIPCSCPYKKGVHHIKPYVFKFPALPPGIPSYMVEGDVEMTAWAFQDDTELGCLFGMASVV